MAFNFNPPQQNQQMPMNGFQQQFQQPMQPMAPGALNGIFTGMEQAKAHLGVIYCRSGRYWGVIRKCKLDKNRKMIIYAAVEQSIVRVLDSAQGLGHRQGEEVTFYTSRDKDYFLSDIKSFICGVSGEPEESITQAVCEQVFGPQNPFQYMTVEWSGQDITTKQGTSFTRITWHREVPAAEVLQTLTPQELNMYYPAGVLQTLAAQQPAQPTPSFQAPAAQAFAPQQPQVQFQQPQFQQNGVPQQNFQNGGTPAQMTNFAPQNNNMVMPPATNFAQNTLPSNEQQVFNQINSGLPQGAQAPVFPGQRR